MTCVVAAWHRSVCISVPDHSTRRNRGHLTIVTKKPHYGRIGSTNTHEEKMGIISRSVLVISKMAIRVSS